MLALLISIIDSAEDQQLFEHLYNHYKQYVYKTAFNMLGDEQLAEDAVQEAFLRVAVNFERFRAGLEDIEEVKHLKDDPDRELKEELQIKCPKTRAFLVVIVERICANRLKSMKRHPEIIIDNPDNISNQQYSEWKTDDPEQISETGLVYDCIFQSISEMTDASREVLFLRIVYEYTPSETAAILGKSKDQVYKAYERGIKKLRDNLKDKLDKELDIKW